MINIYIAFELLQIVLKIVSKMMTTADIKVAKRSLARRRKFIGVLCLLGFILSCYAVYVENAKTKDPSYTALCDISESISCTNIFTSP